jgi:Kdo2-lipid IVA lauroyltransferase/acyltransferase
VTGLAAAVGRLPLPVAAWVGCRIGDAAYFIFRSRRRLALGNLDRVFPERSPAERRRIYRGSCQHLGLVFVELCALLARPLPQFLKRITIDGLEHVEAAMASHGRALGLSAHLGNWEILSAAHRLSPYPLAVVVRPLDSAALNGLAEAVRNKTGVELIDKRRALRPVLTALGQGRIVGILLDQNASRREGVFVPFFGRPASTSRSIALLAVRTGTPVLPIFARREAGGRHRVIVHPPIELPPTNDPEVAVVELTARCTAAIEAAVRETPEQWLWMHNRWRTRPPD